MDNFTKLVLIVLVILYVVSPLDALPEPIDDILVVVLGMASAKGLSGD